MSTPSPVPFLPALTEISRLKQGLLGLPDRLHQARRALTELQDREGDATRLAAERKAELEYLVMNDVDAGGKPRYSNESARKAALAKALTEDADYQDMSKRLRLVTGERQSAGLEVERLTDEQKALRAVTDAICAEVQLLVSGR